MIAYRATLDVPRELAQVASGLLADERRRRGTPRGSRALTCFWQAVLGLRWFRDRTAPDALARDHGISRATAYRYVEYSLTGRIVTISGLASPRWRRTPVVAKADGIACLVLICLAPGPGGGRRSHRCASPAS